MSGYTVLSMYAVTGILESGRGGTGCCPKSGERYITPRASRNGSCPVTNGERRASGLHTTRASCGMERYRFNTLRTTTNTEPELARKPAFEEDTL